MAKTTSELAEARQQAFRDIADLVEQRFYQNPFAHNVGCDCPWCSNNKSIAAYIRKQSEI